MSHVELTVPRIARLRAKHARVVTLVATYESVRSALVDAKRDLAHESKGLDAILVAALVREGDK